MNPPDFGVFVSFKCLGHPIFCVEAAGADGDVMIFFLLALRLMTSMALVHRTVIFWHLGLWKLPLHKIVNRYSHESSEGRALSHLSSATFVPQAAWFALSGCVYCTCVVTSAAAWDTNTSSSLHRPWGGAHVLTWVRDHVKWPWPHLPTIY